MPALQLTNYRVQSLVGVFSLQLVFFWSLLNVLQSFLSASLEFFQRFILPVRLQLCARLHACSGLDTLAHLYVFAWDRRRGSPWRAPGKVSVLRHYVAPSNAPLHPHGQRSVISVVVNQLEDRQATGSSNINRKVTTYWVRLVWLDS